MATITNPLLSLLGTLAPKALQAIQAGQVPAQIPLTDGDAQARDDRDIEMYKAGLGGGAEGTPKTEEEQSQPKLVDSAPVNPSPIPSPLAPVVNTPTENFQDLSAPKTSPSPIPTPQTKKPGKFSLPNVLRVAGAVGGAMESAGNRGNAPGAEKLRETYEAQANRDLQSRRLEEVDKPNAQSEAALRNAQAAGLKDTVPVTVNGVTYYVRRGDLPKTLAPQITGASRENVQDKKNEGALDLQDKKNTGAETVARLKAGAPMFISEDMAKLAEQPELANKSLSGASLSNFVKVLMAKGYGFKDLGEEGAWVVDRGGNKIKQVSVSSASTARAETFAKARAQYTPVDVFDENGNLTSVSQLDQLKGGIPKAQTVFSEQGPTSASRNMAQMAYTLVSPYQDQNGIMHKPHLQTLKDEISELSPYIGPFMGRFEKLFAGNIGSTGNPELDKKMGQLISDLKLASSAVGRTHFAGRTGLPASQYFESLFNMARSPEELQGILTSVPQYIEGYAGMQNFTPKKVGGKAPAKNTSPQSPSAPSSSVKGGQKVTLKSGKSVTVTAVYPDGSFDAN